MELATSVLICWAKADAVGVQVTLHVAGDSAQTEAECEQMDGWSSWVRHAPSLNLEGQFSKVSEMS